MLWAVPRDCTVFEKCPIAVIGDFEVLECAACSELVPLATEIVTHERGLAVQMILETLPQSVFGSGCPPDVQYVAIGIPQNIDALSGRYFLL